MAQAKRSRGNIAPPVWPNAGVEHWYYAQLCALIDEMSLDMLRRIRAAWEENPPIIIGTLSQDAAPTTLLQRALERWGGLWTRKLESLSLNLAAKFADRNFSASQAAMKKSFETAGLAVKFKPTRGSMTAYKTVIAENVGLIKSIPSQYLDRVQGAVWASVRKGADLSTLSASLRKEYGVTVRRAALIARDQNNKAKALIENVRRREIGVREAIWLHSTAGKEPRPTHVDMSGQRYLITAEGSEPAGMYDSDPREKRYVFPGELINCRCVSKAIIPGFE